MQSLFARTVANLILGIFCATGPFTLLVAAVTSIQQALTICSSLSAEGVIVVLQPVRPYKPSSRTAWAVFRFTANNGLCVGSKCEARRTQTR